VPLNAIRQPWNACQCSQKLLLLSLFFSSTSLLLSLVFSTRILQLLSCSLNKTVVSSSCSWHLTKKPLGLSPRFLQLLLLSLVLSTRMLQLSLGISPRTSWPLTKISSTSCSWHLTKNLLASHQESLFFFGFTKSLLTQEWVRPLALINLMREGEEFSNLTVEIRSDGWLRFGVSSLTLTLIIKLSFNLHLTN
jgi:hypothetical protein